MGFHYFDIPMQAMTMMHNECQLLDFVTGKLQEGGKDDGETATLYAGRRPKNNVIVSHNFPKTLCEYGPRLGCLSINYSRDENFREVCARNISTSLLVNQPRYIRKKQMHYVHHENGGPENLSIKTTAVPSLREKEVLMKVYSSAVNRADTLQRKGLYPAPPGESSILGLEAAGTVEKLGPGCTGKWKLHDRVMALLTGGGYAEYVAIPEDLLMPVPGAMGFTTAAGIPEVWLTAYQLLHVAGELQKGDTVLIHAGGSGVGTAAVQLCVLAGCRPVVTAGSNTKLQKAKELGAVAGFNYKEGDFGDKVLEFTNGRGVDLILDCVGGSFYEQNIKSVKTEGRWVLYGLLGGGSVNDNIFSKLLAKRIRLTATTLRARSIEAISNQLAEEQVMASRLSTEDVLLMIAQDLDSGSDFEMQEEYKKKVVDGFTQNALPLFEGGASPRLVPIIDSVYPLHKVADAHRHMESNQNLGKIVLQVRDDTSGETIHEEL